MSGFGYRTPQDLAAASNRRLSQFLRTQVAAYHPYYRRVWSAAGVEVDRVRCVRDLERLPFTGKADLLPTGEEPNRPIDFVLRPNADLLRQYASPWQKAQLLFDRLAGGPARARARVEREYRPIFMTWTTGRSARPIPFLYTLLDIEILKKAGSRLIDVIDTRPDAKTINLFPYAPHLAFWQVQMAGFAHGVMVVGTGGGKTMSTEGNLQLIERMRAEVVVGVPSYVYHVLRRAVRGGVKLPEVKRIVLGAERVPEGLKEKIRDTLAELGARDVAVFGTYGFTEARMAFAESPHRPAGGYLLYPDLGVFEIVDPTTGAVLPQDADGELVYTPLAGRGSVVVRYRTGDLVRGGIRIEKVPSLGGYLPVLSPNITRVSNIREMDLKKVKGTLIDLNELSSLLSGTPEIEEWQVEIKKKDDDPYEVDQLEIAVALRHLGGLTEREFCENLKSRVFMSCEVQPNAVTVLPLDELVSRLGLETEMKEKRIVDRRPKK